MLRDHPALFVPIAVTFAVLPASLFLAEAVLAAVARVVGVTHVSNPLSAYLVLSVALLTVAVPAVYAYGTVARATAQLARDGEVSLAGAAVVTLRRTPSLLTHAVVLAVGALALRAAERRYDLPRTLTTLVFGTGFTVLSGLAVPAAVVDGAGPIEMYRASVTAVREEFGDAVYVSFAGIGPFYLASGIAGTLGLVLGIALTLEPNPDPGATFVATMPTPVETAVVGGAFVVAGWLLILGGAVTTVVRTRLYLEITGGD